MATDALEIRMARLEGAYEQINERLALVERELGALRTDLRTGLAEAHLEFAGVRAEVAGVREEITGVRGEIRGVREEMAGLRAEVRADVHALRADHADLRGQVQTQFYWLLIFILSSILVPVLRDLAR